MTEKDLSGVPEADGENSLGRDAPVRDGELPAGDDAVGEEEEAEEEVEIASIHDGEGSAVKGAGKKDEEEAPRPSTAGSAPEAERTRLQTSIIIAALCSALFLAALDVTIVATAIPTIAAQFHSNLGYTWIGSAYLLANAAFVPTWGKISDIWGRKPVILTAVGIFWVGSLLCATSVNMGMLIAARAIQGVGGGGAIVLVNICISDLFSMRNRSFYFSIMGCVWAVASAVGPVVGGVFTTKVSWRWCFYVNLPISGVGMLVLLFVLKLHSPRTPMRSGLAAIDWIGSLTIVGGTLMFLLGLEFGGVLRPWHSPTVICLILFGAITIFFFVLNEWKVARYPVIPLRLFQNRSNIAAFATSFCHGFVFISGSYWLPLYFQGVLGVDALRSGLYLLPYVLSLSVMSASIGVIIRRTGKYVPGIVGGMAMTVLGFGLFIDLDPYTNFVKLVIFQIIAGLGIGPNFQSPLIALQTTVEPRDIASATSTFAFIRQMATSISVVIGGVIFNNEMQKQFPTLKAELGEDLAKLLSGSNAAASVGVVAQLQGEQGRIARGAYFNSLRVMYIVYVSFAALGLFMSFFIAAKKLSKEHKEHKTGLKTLRSREAKPGDEEKADKGVKKEEK